MRRRLARLLRRAVTLDAEAVYLSTGERPRIRLGETLQVLNAPVVEEHELDILLRPFRRGEGPWSGGYALDETTRVELWAYRHAGGLAARLRLQATARPLALPARLTALARHRTGLVLVGGDATARRALAAALVGAACEQRRCHVGSLRPDLALPAATLLSSFAPAADGGSLERAAARCDVVLADGLPALGATLRAAAAALVVVSVAGRSPREVLAALPCPPAARPLLAATLRGVARAVPLRMTPLCTGALAASDDALRAAIVADELPDDAALTSGAASVSLDEALLELVDGGRLEPKAALENARDPDALRARLPQEPTAAEEAAPARPRKTTRRSLPESVLRALARPHAKKPDEPPTKKRPASSRRPAQRPASAKRAAGKPGSARRPAAKPPASQRLAFKLPTRRPKDGGRSATRRKKTQRHGATRVRRAPPRPTTPGSRLEHERNKAEEEPET